MTRIDTSAPGKIVLSGEYAVLYGAPAVATAINCRARVSIKRRENGASLVRTSGYRHSETEIRMSADGSVEWPAGDGLPLVDHVSRMTGGLSWASFLMKLDTRDFFDLDANAKYGFGSSAALCCALTLALAEAQGNATNALSSAAAAHLAFQDGVGSGVDIAACFHGGLSEFRMHQNFACTALQWPTGLHWTTIWTGHSAGTRNQLQKLTGLDTTDKSVTNLLTAAESIAREWRGGVARKILEEMSSYTNVLHEFDRKNRLGIFDSGHADLRRMAEQKGILYKPCGSGGGDIGIAFSTEKGKLKAFEDDAEAAGFRRLAILADARGATIDHGCSCD